MDLISKQEAADFLGIHPDTLDVLCKAGKIAFYRITPKRMSFARADLEAYVAAQRVEVRAPKVKAARQQWDQRHRPCLYKPGDKVV